MSFTDMPDLGPFLRPDARQYAEDCLRLSRAAVERTRTILDIPYGPDFFQKLDIFLPRDIDEDVALPVLLCVAQFDLGWRPLLMGVALEASVIAIDSVLLPRLQGERLDVDPVVVLVSLGFWNAIFGITGALFSTLLTVVVIAIVSEVPRLHWLAVILSKRAESVPD